MIWTPDTVPSHFEKGGSGILTNCLLCDVEAILSYSEAPICSSSSAEVCAVLRALVVVTRPLPRDGGFAEDHGVPEAGQLPKAWTIGRKETESCQRASGAESPLLDSAE